MTKTPSLISLPLALFIAAAQCGAAFAESFDCVMEPASVIRIGPSSPGVLHEVFVRRGDHVKAGQIIASTDSESAKASVALLELKSQSTVELDSQQAHVAFIKSQLERERKLTERSLQSVSKLQEAEFNYLTAQAMLQQARVNLASAKAELERQKIALRDTDIRSPIDGVILEITLSVGEYASGDRYVAKIAQLDPLHVEAFLPVELYSADIIGREVYVTPDAPMTGQFLTQIRVADPVFDTASRTFGVSADLANPDGVLPGGHRCKIEFTAGPNQSN